MALHPSSYPDMPSRRHAYHDDGSVFHGFRHGSHFPAATLGYFPPVVFTAFTAQQAADANDENPASLISGTGGGGAGAVMAQVLFPERREIDGYYWNGFATYADWIAYSTDTQSGRDGTWLALGSQVFYEGADTFEDYRSRINTTALSNVRGITGYVDAGGAGSFCAIKSLHLYGTISAGETPDRLLWIDDVTDLEFTLPLDYGDIPRGSAEDYAVYLTNNSASLTANSVQLTVEDTFLDMATWFTMSEGGAFQSTLPLAAAIGPAANSPVITVRRNTPDAASTGLYFAWLLANVGSWT